MLLDITKKGNRPSILVSAIGEKTLVKIPKLDDVTGKAIIHAAQSIARLASRRFNSRSVL